MKKVAQVGTLVVMAQNVIVAFQGTLVSNDENSITLDVKRHGSKKTDRTLFPMKDVRQAWLSEAVNESYVYVVGNEESSYGDVTLNDITDGFFSGQSGDSAIIAAPGTWRFLPVVEDEEETAPAPKAKAKPKAAAEEEEEKPAAKAKAKAAPVTEPEDEYVPAKGDYVKITDADEEETEGLVATITSKSITLEDGVKHLLADVTVEEAETPAPKAKAKAKAAPAVEEPEAEAYVPEEGDYISVTVTKTDEVSEGTVTVIGAKKVTIADADGDETSFVLSAVTMEEATKPAPKAKAKAKAAPAVEEEETPAPKAKAKAKAAPAVEEGDGWGDE